MANSFSGDITCKALWRFESGALVTDSIGSNTLTNNNSVAETSTCQEGSTAADFEDGSSQYFSIADASLASGFPLKSGDTTKQATFCFWMRPETVPGAGNYDRMLGKWDWGAGKISISIAMSNNYLRIGWGYGSGTSNEGWDDIHVILAGNWYHVGVVIDGVGKWVQIRIYDGYYDSTRTYRKFFTNELRIVDFPFTVGAENAASYFDGILDEVVVFNRCLNDFEIDSICKARHPVSHPAVGTNDLLSQTYILDHEQAYNTLSPPDLVEFEETFDSDAGQFTKYTEGSAGSTSIADNKYTITHSSGALNDIITLNTADDLNMPQCFIQIDIAGITSNATFYDNSGVGLVKDANNFIFASIDRIAGNARIQIKIAGSNAFYATVTGQTWSAPFKIAFSLVGNSACFYKDVGSGWVYVTGYDVTAIYDFRTSGNLTGWKPGFTLANSDNSSVWSFANFTGGGFGGVCLRDIVIVTREDGSANIQNDTLQFLATSGDPRGGGYAGVFTYDFGDNSLNQNGVIMVNRDGKIYPDLAGHIIYYGNGDRRLLISSWGNGFSGELAILHKLITDDDILSTGKFVVSSMSELSVPGLLDSDYGAYDPMLVYDSRNARWLLAYTIVKDTAFTDDFYAALAESADLSSFDLIGADTTRHNYEGSRIINIGTDYFVLCGGKGFIAGLTPGDSGDRALIYDSDMTYLGQLDITFSGGNKTSPHPMIFRYSDDYLYVLTFDNYTSYTADFTWGRVILHSAKALAEMRRQFPVPPTGRVLQSQEGKRIFPVVH